MVHVKPSRTLLRLPGTEVSFLSPISCRQDSSLHDLPWVPKGRLEQLLIKGGAARKPPEARLKGPRKLLKIRRPWDPAHTLILSATLPLGSIAIKLLIRGLPWWRSGWESACQCRGRGFEPWSRKIPHAAEQLGPVSQNYWACASGACAPQQERPR